jgi:hypothetical protein
LRITVTSIKGAAISIEEFHKARRGKTRQDKTRQDTAKARQGKTRQDKEQGKDKDKDEDRIRTKQNKKKQKKSPRIDIGSRRGMFRSIFQLKALLMLLFGGGSGGWVGGEVRVRVKS